MADAAKKFAQLSIDIVKSAVNLAGELEQNIGGSEAVFGDLADAIQAKGTLAYTRLGLSQSEYLASANKMGSLLQGMGFSVEESFDLTTQAMQRAADVASIMGISTESAMEAINGAAKGNFTMMDNLGVAINDTALANYALEKGITKSVAKMTTQEKVSLALKLFMERSAYAAGNYAKENDTLSGSISTMKAAFENFMSGGGSPEAFAYTVENMLSVLTKSLNTLIPKLTRGFSKLMERITPMISELIETLLPVVITGLQTLMTGVIGAMPEILSALSQTIPAIAQAVTEIFPELIASLVQIAAQLMQTLADMSPELVPVLVDGVIAAITALFKNASKYISAAGALIKGLMTGIKNSLPSIKEQLPDIWGAIADVLIATKDTIVDVGASVLGWIYEGITGNEADEEAIKAKLNGLFDSLGSLAETVLALFGGIGTWYSENQETITGLVDAFAELGSKILEIVQETALPALTKLLEKVGKFVSEHKDDITQVVENLALALENGVAFVDDVLSWIDTHGQAVNDILGFCGAAFVAIGMAISPIKTALAAVIAVGGLVVANWELIKETVSKVCELIKNWVHEKIEAAIEKVKSVTETLVEKWEALKEKASSIWESIAGWVTEKVEGAIQGVINIGDSLAEAWESLKEKASSIWSSITSAIQNAIDKIKSFLGLQSEANETHYADSNMYNYSSPYRVRGSGGNRSITTLAYASGTDYVPYDNALALLHRGEQVVPKNEAERSRESGLDASVIASAVADAVVIALNGVSVQMDGQQVGELVAPVVSSALGANVNRQKRYSGVFA